MSKEVLVEYIRAWPQDSGFECHLTRGHPIGCIVAIAPDKIGYSICCPKDKFCKQKGKSMAIQRAQLNAQTKVPNRYIDIRDDYTWVTLRELLNQKIEKMKERAKRYFKYDGGS